MLVHRHSFLFLYFLHFAFPVAGLLPRRHPGYTIERTTWDTVSPWQQQLKTVTLILCETGPVYRSLTPPSTRLVCVWSAQCTTYGELSNVITIISPARRCTLVMGGLHAAVSVGTGGVGVRLGAVSANRGVRLL